MTGRALFRDATGPLPRSAKVGECGKVTMPLDRIFRDGGFAQMHRQQLIGIILRSEQRIKELERKLEMLFDGKTKPKP